MQQLKQFCWSSLLGMVAELNKHDEATMRRLLIYSDSWFHITRRGGFFGLHNHPMASWSGVYCVSPGEHDADKPDSGLLSFVNPATTSAMYMDAANANQVGPVRLWNPLREIRAGTARAVSVVDPARREAL